MDIDFLEAARRMAEAEQRGEAAAADMRSNVRKGRNIGLTDKQIAEGAELAEDELEELMDESICRVCGNQRLADKHLAELLGFDETEGDQGGQIKIIVDAIGMLGDSWVSSNPLFAKLVSFLRDCGVPEADIRKASKLSDEEFDERMGD